MSLNTPQSKELKVRLTVYAHVPNTLDIERREILVEVKRGYPRQDAIC